MTGWTGISIGDITGIGPEVTLKALSELAKSRDTTRYLLLGDFDHLQTLNEQLGLRLPLQRFENYAQSGSYFVHETQPPLPENLSKGAAPAALASANWVEEGARRCLAKELDALITAPVNKEAIVRAGRRFIGQTELLSELSGTQETAMMLLGSDDRGRWLRVVLATTHVSIRKLPDQLTTEKVLLAIRLAARSCHDLGLPRARVAVCGLNPHAGEGGAIGDEEMTVITPAVRQAKSMQLDVEGPLSADALFYYVFRGDYDAVVAMYHDQGLVPLKMIGFESGVNWTLGLPFIRTSPDHGTAYDIAGQGKASPSSMLSAMSLARQVNERRRRRSL